MTGFMLPIGYKSIRNRSVTQIYFQTTITRCRKQPVYCRKQHPLKNLYHA